MIYPLIRHADIHTSALGERTAQMPAGVRTLEPTKAVVIRVYPPGHPQNRLGQTLVDLQPLAELPMLFKVPVCLSYAHGETEPVTESGPYQTTRRQAYAARARNRVEGSSYDLRQGTYVWVQFLGGSLHDPVVVATMKPNHQDGGSEVRQRLDAIDSDGGVEAREMVPLDGELADYPRSVDAYNGVRLVRDNKGNLYIQTSNDRAPVFAGDGDIPASPEPQGNFGLSTRGARVGHQVFTSGKDPDTGDDSAGRHVRQSLEATDGTIRDETKDSARGDLIRRTRSESGRHYSSSRGSGDGRHYYEARNRAYAALNQLRAELHHPDKAVLDSPAVHLGHDGASENVTLWPALDAFFQALLALFDAHIHTGVQVGAGVTGAPQAPFNLTAQLWSQMGEQAKSDVVFADQSAASSPHHEEDPDDG